MLIELVPCRLDYDLVERFSSGLFAVSEPESKGFATSVEDGARNTCSN